MLATAEIESFVAAQPYEVDIAPELAQLRCRLRKAFGTSFTLWDGETGELLHASVQQPGSNDLFRGQLARAIHGSEPQFIADEDCVLLLAVPLRRGRRDGTSWPRRRSSCAPSRRTNTQRRRDAAGPRQAGDGLDRAAAGLVARSAAAAGRRGAGPDSGRRRAPASLQREVDKLSDNLASTYEEICLLHSVTQNLRINSDEEQLCALVLRWLLDCLPAQAVAIQLLPVAKEGQITYKARTKSVLYTTGECPLDNDGLHAADRGPATSKPAAARWWPTSPSRRRHDWPLARRARS